MAAVERLSVEDVPAIVDLHRATLAALGPGMLRERHPDEFREVIASSGLILGVWSPGRERLVAYATLLSAVPDGYVPPGAVRLPGNARVGVLAGSAVRESHRGRGLHRRLLRERIVLARDAHVLDGLVATAAPSNASSWRNMMAYGLSITAIAPCHGSLRYVMVGETAEPGGRHPAGLSWIAAEDLAGQDHLLSQGMKGVTCRATGAGLEIGFRAEDAAADDAPLVAPVD